MTKISYAQNFEDVILARALADIDAGFYVDVGAQDPLIDSVTQMFYEQGWNGINIEPVPHWFERLQADRPRDVNLMCAVAATEGTLMLHESTDSGLSTASEEYARDHAAAGWDMAKRPVPMRRLDDILLEHAPDVVHFLKIDVEGMEQEVLAGLSLDRYRPWILVIEATRPNTTVDVSKAWETSVLAANYRLVYRDGLNRFYLAEEQLSRLPAFEVPPNVFDDFIPYREHASNEYARSLEERLQVLHDQAQGFRRDLIVVTDTAHASQQRMAELEVALEQRQSLLEETARTAETYRGDLLVVAQTADAQQVRLEELETSLLDRQSLLEDVARTAETYRGDLLAVTQTAHAQQARLKDLESALLDRQSLLEEVAHTAETVTQTAYAQQARLKDLESALLDRQSLLEESARTAERYRVDLSVAHRELHLVAVAAENRRILIEDLETRLGQRDEQLVQVRRALHAASIRVEELQRQLDTIYASRSWRLTVPLRSCGRSARRIVGRILRRAARTPILRKIGGRMLTGRLRRRVLNLAGFTEQIYDRDASSRLLIDVAIASTAQAPLSRAGTRVYGLLASAHEREAQGRQ